MHRSWPKFAAAVLVVAALVGVAALRAAEAPFIGNWKVTDVSSGNEVTYFLIQVEEQGGKPQAKILAAPLIRGNTSIEDFKADGKTMQFDVKMATGVLGIKAYAPKAAAKDKEFLGSITFGSRVMLTKFTKTDDKELTRADAISETEVGKNLQKARGTKDVAKRQELLKELIEKNPDKAVAYSAKEILLESYSKEVPKDEDIRATADQFVKLGARFGPEVEHKAELAACQSLARAAKVSPAAVEFIEKIEKGLTKDTPPSKSVVVFKALARALTKTGKEKEAKTLEPRIAKLEMTLDAEFEKTAVPFKPGEFSGRKGDSKRIALVELFTGAYCPPCVAADVAFDAALETYKPKDVILIQYHLHIPLPDRLTNADAEGREDYYDVNSTPTALVDGKKVQDDKKRGLGGFKDNSRASYNLLRDKIDEDLESAANANVKLHVQRDGDKIEIVGETADLKKPGENVRLRFVLIEEVVRYPGGNGQRLHHHIVRAFPGGIKGFALKEETSKQNVLVNLAEVRKSLDQYMADFHEKDKNKRDFVDDEHPLNLKHLKVVAFIQDDDTKEILQAAQVDVPEGK